MVIIFGTKNKSEDLGATDAEVLCANCHNQSPWHVHVVDKKFTLFFMSIFTLSSTYYLLCPICQYGRQISKQDAKELVGRT